MSGPDPSVAAVRLAVGRATADVRAGELVLVACSGGADSLALAHGAAFAGRRAGWLAGAVVVDHVWSAGSAQAARRAAAAAAGLGLDPVDVVAVDTRGPGGPEASARAARYAALHQRARDLGAVAVLTGHTLDDVAETVLLGLARGSGARSLAGIAARRGLLRRPLLQVRREQTRAACAALGVVPEQDPANDDPAYTRVRVRQAMSTLQEALGPGLVPALARTADLLREDADTLDAEAALLLARARGHGTLPEGLAESRSGLGTVAEPAGDVPAGPGRPRLSADVPAGPGRLRLSADVLAAAPDALRRRALLAAIRAAGSPAGSVGRRHVLAVDALVTRWRGQGAVHLPGRVEAWRDCGTLWLAGP